MSLPELIVAGGLGLLALWTTSILARAPLKKQLDLEREIRKIHEDSEKENRELEIRAAITEGEVIAIQKVLGLVGKVDAQGESRAIWVQQTDLSQGPSAARVASETKRHAIKDCV